MLMKQDTEYMCLDCQDTGWLENRVEGKYPCTCISETEPYQQLLAKVNELGSFIKRHAPKPNGIPSSNYSKRDALLWYSL
jgi:hypothetical protein